MVEGERASQDVFHGLRWIERCVGVLEHDLYLAEFVEAAAGVQPVLYLAGDEARAVSGEILPVAGGDV